MGYIKIKKRLAENIVKQVVNEAWNPQAQTKVQQALNQIVSIYQSLGEVSPEVEEAFKNLYETIENNAGGTAQQASAPSKKPESVAGLAKQVFTSNGNGGMGGSGSSSSSSRNEVGGMVQTSIDVYWSEEDERKGPYIFYLHTQDYMDDGSVDDGDTYWEEAQNPDEALYQWIENHTYGGYSSLHYSVSLFNFKLSEPNTAHSDSSTGGSATGGSMDTKPADKPSAKPKAPAKKEINAYENYSTLSLGEPSMYVGKGDSPEEMYSTLNQKLHEGPVAFVYAKQSGEERVAYGTLNPDFLKQALGDRNQNNSGLSKTGGNAGYKLYYDLEKKRFGRFAVDHLIAVY